MTSRWALALLLAGCDDEVPLNPYAGDPPNVLRGDLLVGATDDRGVGVVLLSAAEDPPPPLGTGRPVSFVGIGPDRFTPTDAGLIAAPFTLEDVPDGAWILTGLMDHDLDFHPGLPTLAGATCGDRTGAWIGADGLPAVVQVAGGQLVEPLIVALGAPLTTERPAFSIDAAAPIQPGQAFGLTSIGLSATYGSDLSLVIAGPSNPIQACESSFLLHFHDVDRDGVVDPRPDLPAETGLLDVWPRIYVEWLGEVGETGLTRDDPARYVTEAIPYSPCGPPGCAPPEATVIGAPTRVSHLTALLLPAVVRIDASGVTSVPPDQVPAGAWSITVVLETGQTWTVPNELGGGSPFPDLTLVPSQGGWLGVGG